MAEEKTLAEKLAERTKGLEERIPEGEKKIGELTKFEEMGLDIRDQIAEAKLKKDGEYPTSEYLDEIMKGTIKENRLNPNDLPDYAKEQRERLKEAIESDLKSPQRKEIMDNLLNQKAQQISDADIKNNLEKTNELINTYKEAGLIDSTESRDAKVAVNYRLMSTDKVKELFENRRRAINTGGIQRTFPFQKEARKIIRRKQARQQDNFSLLQRRREQ